MNILKEKYKPVYNHIFAICYTGFCYIYYIVLRNIEVNILMLVDLILLSFQCFLIGLYAQKYWTILKAIKEIENEK